VQCSVDDDCVIPRESPAMPRVLVIYASAFHGSNNLRDDRESAIGRRGMELPRSGRFYAPTIAIDTWWCALTIAALGRRRAP